VPVTDPRRISPIEAHAKMSEGYTYLDVRTEAEFAEGRPAGAVNVPFTKAAGGNVIDDPGFLDAVAARFGKDARLVVGCRSGQRSLRAARALLAVGYVDVFEQRAGWDGVRDAFGSVEEPGWSRVGLPAERGAR
jgi:rhodanese-related sulfurtransferase